MFQLVLSVLEANLFNVSIGIISSFGSTFLMSQFWYYQFFWQNVFDEFVLSVLKTSHLFELSVLKHK